MIAAVLPRAELRFPLHRFEEFEPLTPAELAAVLQLPLPPRIVQKGGVIRAEGIASTSFFVLLDGWAAASHSMLDGGRQILKIHLPGDALGTPSMAMSRTVEELTALTDVVVAEVPLERFGHLFTTHPRVAARFMLSIQLERIALMDRLAFMGRSTAEARTAAFILDLSERLKPLGKVHAGSFDLPLTQEQLADVLGLTAVHVNRMLKSITDRGLISRAGSTLTCLDVEGLALLSARTKRQRTTHLAWLPDARN